MKIVCYFKKHFVTRIRNFVFTYRKSIERKCPVTSIVRIVRIVRIVLVRIWLGDFKKCNTNNFY